MQLDPRVERIVDGVEQLPIEVRPGAKAADVAGSGRAKAVTEITVIPHADEWVRPTQAGRRVKGRQQSLVQSYALGSPPGANAQANIDVLVGLNKRPIRNIAVMSPGPRARPFASDCP